MGAILTQTTTLEIIETVRNCLHHPDMYGHVSGGTLLIDDYVGGLCRLRWCQPRAGGPVWYKKAN